MDRQKEEEDFSKEDAAPPTVANELVFLTGVINAKEHRDVATAEITGPTSMRSMAMMFAWCQMASSQNNW